MTDYMTFISTDATPCASGTASTEVYGECLDDELVEALQMITFITTPASATAGTIECDSPAGTIYAPPRHQRALCKCLDNLAKHGGSVHIKIWYELDMATGNLLVKAFRCTHYAASANVQVAFAAATLRETRELHHTLREVLALLRHGPKAQHHTVVDKLRRDLANVRALGAEAAHVHSHGPTSNPSSQNQTPPHRSPDGN